MFTVLDLPPSKCNNSRVTFFLTIYTPRVIVATLIWRRNKVDSKKIIRMIEKDGWFLVRVKGDHHQFKHSTKPGLVTVAHPSKDIPKGTLNSIRKQAGLK